MGLYTRLGYSRCFILPFFAAVTVIVTSFPVIAKINIEECEQLLLTALVNNPSISSDSIRISRNANGRIIQNGSLSAQAGIRMIKDGVFDLPRAPLINKNYDLVEGQSDIFFIELSGKPSRTHHIGGFDSLVVYTVKDDIEPDLYHFLLALGYVAITRPVDDSSEESFSHDVLDHVPGFKKISETPLWPKIKRLMLEVLYAETKLPPSSDVFTVAAQIRFDLASYLETYSTRLSSEDQQRLTYHRGLAELAAKIEKSFIFWQETKSVFNFIVPEAPFSLQERARRLRGGHATIQSGH